MNNLYKKSQTQIFFPDLGRIRRIRKLIQVNAKKLLEENKRKTYFLIKFTKKFRCLSPSIIQNVIT